MKCRFMPLFISQEKHAQTVTYYSFSSEITLNVVEFRGHVVQTATQEDEFSSSILSVLSGKVISKVSKRQIQYPKEQIIKASLRFLQKI